MACPFTARIGHPDQALQSGFVEIDISYIYSMTRRNLNLKREADDGHTYCWQYRMLCLFRLLISKSDSRLSAVQDCSSHSKRWRGHIISGRRKGVHWRGGLLGRSIIVRVPRFRWLQSNVCQLLPGDPKFEFLGLVLCDDGRSGFGLSLKLRL